MAAIKYRESSVNKITGDLPQKNEVCIQIKSKSGLSVGGRMYV